MWENFSFKIWLNVLQQNKLKVVSEFCLIMCVESELIAYTERE